MDVFTRSQDEHVPHVLHDLGYGNRVVHIPAGPEVPTPKSELPNYLPDFIEGIQRFYREKGLRYNLIHSHYWMSGIAALELKRLWQIPLISMFHTLGHMKNFIAQSEAEKEPPARLAGEEKVLAESDCIVISTPAERSQIKKLYQATPKKLAVIPPGVDTSRFYPINLDEARQAIGLPSSNCMLLFVGRIEPLKGIDTLLKAIALMLKDGVLQDCPHYLAVIGGETDVPPDTMNSEMSRLQKLADELGVNDLVIFLGKQAQETLPYYYSAAQVVIMPSHYESFGMVALEAMACGTPVVASEVGGLAHLVKDGITGFCVPNGNPQALAAKLTTLIQNPALRHEMGRNASREALAYDWNKIACRILKLYQSVL